MTQSIIQEWLVNRPVLSAAATRAHDGLRWFRWRVTRPTYPRDRPLRLHLGCGDIDVPGFVNVDARPGPNVHHVMRIEDLSGFATGSAELVYASHCLEHVSHHKVAAVLAEWFRVLRPGGLVRISVPDFDLLCVIYAASGHRIESIIQPLMGGQNHPANFHYTCFTESSLRECLAAAGFVDVKRWQHGDGPYRSLPDWSGRNLEWDGITFPVSLNLEARKGS